MHVQGPRLIVDASSGLSENLLINAPITCYLERREVVAASSKGTKQGIAPPNDCANIEYYIFHRQKPFHKIRPVENLGVRQRSRLDCSVVPACSFHP